MWSPTPSRCTGCNHLCDARRPRAASQQWTPVNEPPRRTVYLGEGGVTVSQDLAGLATDLEGFFARRVPLRWDAEDLTQETFVRALANWGQARQPDAARA